MALANKKLNSDIANLLGAEWIRLMNLKNQCYNGKGVDPDKVEEYAKINRELGELHPIRILFTT